MGRVVALGEAARVAGYGLAGAVVVAAEDPDAVRAAWAALPADASVVLLTHEAAAALGGEVDREGRVLVAVMPP